MCQNECTRRSVLVVMCFEKSRGTSLMSRLFFLKIQSIGEAKILLWYWGSLAYRSQPVGSSWSLQAFQSLHLLKAKIFFPLSKLGKGFFQISFSKVRVQHISDLHFRYYNLLFLHHSYMYVPLLKLIPILLIKLEKKKSWGNADCYYNFPCLEIILVHEDNTS